MKKLLAILLTVFMTISLAACGGNTEEKTDSNADNETSNVTNASTNEDNEKTDNDTENEITFSYSYKVPGKNIVIDVPNYQEMEKGYTQLYIMHGEKYVAITAHQSANASSVAEAHNVAFELFKENIQNYSYVDELTIQKDNTEQISGIEVYKYEGTFRCALDYTNRENSYDAYAVGYSFIMDGVPCTVTGSVIDESQSQEMIDEIKTTVEAMIKTLRTER